MILIAVQFNADISLGSLISAAGVLVALWVFFHKQRLEAKDQLEATVRLEVNVEQHGVDIGELKSGMNMIKDAVASLRGFNDAEDRRRNDDARQRYEMQQRNRGR